MAEGSESTTATNPATPAGETPAGQGGTPETFEGWLGKQNEATKALLETHTGGLKSSLESERNDRKEVQRQLNALKAEGDPAALKTQLATLQATLDEQTARNEFAEEAHTQGVTNIRLAYLAAKDAELLGKRNLWDELKRQSPELFAKKVAPPAAAGTGSGTSPSGALTMNDLLRGVRAA